MPKSTHLDRAKEVPANAFNLRKGYDKYSANSMML
jgi:hypothetical protein